MATCWENCLDHPPEDDRPLCQQHSVREKVPFSPVSSYLNFKTFNTCLSYSKFCINDVKIQTELAEHNPSTQTCPNFQTKTAQLTPFFVPPVPGCRFSRFSKLTPISTVDTATGLAVSLGERRIFLAVLMLDFFRNDIYIYYFFFQLLSENFETILLPLTLLNSQKTVRCRISLSCDDRVSGSFGQHKVLLAGNSQIGKVRASFHIEFQCSKIFSQPSCHLSFRELGTYVCFRISEGRQALVQKKYGSC